MKAKFIEPIDELTGKLTSNVYTRMLNGMRVVQRCPRQSSEKQRAMRKRFGELYKGKHPS